MTFENVTASEQVGAGGGRALVPRQDMSLVPGQRASLRKRSCIAGGGKSIIPIRMVDYVENETTTASDHVTVSLKSSLGMTDVKDGDGLQWDELFH